MKLVELQITSDFKNLKGIDIKFSQTANSHVLIGNNGTGKTSVLEVLSAIFKSLYHKDAPSYDFNFRLVYMYDNHIIQIVYSIAKKSLICKIDKKEVDVSVITGNYLPSRVICNYSGEDIRIKSLYYQDLWDDYITKLKDAKGSNSLKMWFVDKNMWSIMLLVMLATKNQKESFANFVNNTLGINTVDGIYLEIREDILAKWKDNAVTFYVRQLQNRMVDGFLTIESINPIEEEPLVLFSNLAGAIPLIKSLKIRYNQGIDSSSLSEGEKKLMVILFIEEVLADQESLVLLDEPDSHIHVARKEELHKMITCSINRENLLTSHSPTLTARFEQDAIIMLDKNENGFSEVVDKNKRQIVSHLTNGLWSLQEQNIFLASNKDVIIVEGKTDEIFLDKALKYMHSCDKFSEMDFSYLPCGGASNVEVLLKKFIPKKGQLMICFFDRDRAGWEAINKVFQKMKPKLFTPENFGKARKNGSVWFAPYPRPMGKSGDFNIEDYFPRPVFLKYVMHFKNLNEIMTKDSIKAKMAEDCSAGVVSGKKFAKFEEVFTLINDIKAAEIVGNNSL